MVKSHNFWGKLLILLGIGSLYIGNQVYTIYGGDAGDLVSAIATYGIPHPPGYPLYTLLGIILNTFIRTGTAAWRVGFLSSIPAILTLIILFDLLFYLTKKFTISLVSVLVLAFSYPFWLFSEVVEVFSLNNLFTVFLLWNFVRFARTGRKKFFYLGVFILGLSLTHHHIIIFLLPSLFILFWTRKNLLKGTDLMKGLTVFLVGLLPYLYVLIAASRNPALNWLDSPTSANLFGLITRSTYGTFTAGSFIAHEPILRFLDIWGFINFAIKDFRLAGVIFFLAGVVYLFRSEKNLFFVFASGLASYLFFLFYASFPLTENFIVGTFERFVLPLYIFVSIFISFGLVIFDQLINRLLLLVSNKKKAKTFLIIVSLMFFVYPAGLLFLNYPKISILKNDFTAENLGYDVLSTVPPESIILISIDTPLFDSQYVYFTQRKWPKVNLAHFYKLLNPKSVDYYKKYFPEMNLPDYSKNPKGQLDSFINSNYAKFSIFSKQAYMSDEGVWIPWGLLFRYFKKDDVPSDNFILEENRKIWSSYHDPLSGSLVKYQNLLLSDVLRIYSVAHQEIGFWSAKRGYNEAAEEHLLLAEKLTPGDLDSYNLLSQVYIQQKKCGEAKKQIDFRIEKEPQDPNSYLLMSLNYRLCYQDEKKASGFQKIYEEKQKLKETPLKKL